MALSEENTTLNFVLSKNIKHKLQVLADADNKKLGAYVSQRLQEIIEEFEYQILEIYGSDEFIQTYWSIFGTEHPPLIPYDFDEEVDEEAARRNIIAAINGLRKAKGIIDGKDIRDIKATVIGENPGQHIKQPIGRALREQDIAPMRRQADKKEPSDE